MSETVPLSMVSITVASVIIFCHMLRHAVDTRGCPSVVESFPTGRPSRPFWHPTATSDGGKNNRLGAGLRPGARPQKWGASGGTPTSGAQKWGWDPPDFEASRASPWPEPTDTTSASLRKQPYSCHREVLVVGGRSLARSLLFLRALTAGSGRAGTRGYGGRCHPRPR